MTADTLPTVALHLRCRCGVGLPVDADVHASLAQQVRLSYWRIHQQAACLPYEAASNRLELLTPTEIRHRHPLQAVPADDDGYPSINWAAWLATCLVGSGCWYALYRLWAAVAGR